MKQELKFECGATSALDDDGTWSEHCRSIGQRPRRRDGRYRCVTFASGEVSPPRLPSGKVAPCFNCPCPKESGCKVVRTMDRKFVVSCYPDEVAVE